MKKLFLTTTCVVLLCTGCAGVSIRQPTPAESSTCQELLAESTRRQIEALRLQQFLGKKAYIRVTHVTGKASPLDSSYVEQLLINELVEAGVVAVSEHTRADVILACTIDVGGVTKDVSTFPPGWLFYVFPLSYTKELEARVLLELFSYTEGVPGALAIQSPEPTEASYTERYVLGIGPIR
ncbi:MAG: hypothetical protein HQ592_00290 [Planctomycetes bacterium]|nr:hypothetical protein [Planctomycetota bacterium]